MKKFSFLKYSALCLVALFSVAVMSSCDNDSPEEPEAPVIPENPENPDDSENPEDPYEEVDYMNVLDFNGFYLKEVGEIDVEYKDFDNGSSKPNIIEINNADPKDKNKVKQFSLNYKKKDFDDGDIAEHWYAHSLNFTPQGYLSGLQKEKRTLGGGNTYTSVKIYTDEMAFTYEGGNRLSSILIVDGYEYDLAVYDDYYELKNEDIHRTISQEEISLTWDNDNIVKIVKVEKNIEESLRYYYKILTSEERNETSDTTVYEIEYDNNTLNSARQYPWFVSRFIMNNRPAETMFPMTGLLGKFSINLPVRVTVTKDNGEIETYNVEFFNTVVNGFNVIGTEYFNGTEMQYKYGKP